MDISKKLEIGKRLKEFADHKFKGEKEKFSSLLGFEERTSIYPFFKDKILDGEKLAILDILGCDLSWLLNGQGHMDNSEVKETLQKYSGQQNEINLLVSENEALTRSVNGLKAKLYDNTLEFEKLRDEFKKIKAKLEICEKRLSQK